MERAALRRVVVAALWLAALGLGAVPTLVRAQAPGKGKGKGKAVVLQPIAGADDETKKSQGQRQVTKVRPGSLLRAHGPTNNGTAPKVVDLRSDLERWRDSELARHYRRMAELDVIAELATKSHEVTLLEQVDEVRRKELQRFREAMQLLRQEARQRRTAPTSGAAP